MEARERLARVVALSYCRNDIEPDSEATWALYMDDGRHCADAILKALHLTDAAALALMDGEAVVMPEAVSDQMYKRGLDAAVTSGSIQRIWDAMLDASPYKENPDDPR